MSLLARFTVPLTRAYASYQQQTAGHRRISLGIGTALLICLLLLLFLENISLTPDVLLAVLLLAAIAFGQVLRFLRDWIPFVGLLLVYESLRGLADNLGAVAHSADLIATEKWLFAGHVPTLLLQSWLWRGQTSWYDWLFTLLYFMHFVLPLLLAFWLWLNRPRAYWQFVASLVVLCFAGFITYIIFPATPPWLAARQGDLPEVIKVIDHVLALFPNHMTISTFYHNLNPNPVAAMPSLHAAFPFLVWLFLRQEAGKWAWLFLPYCLALWLGIVYMGEHYVIDAVAGVLYATAAFATVRWWWQRSSANKDTILRTTNVMDTG